MSEANNQTRELGKRQQELNRRDLLVLIFNHLLEEGFSEAANAIKQQLIWDVTDYAVCDNIDLPLILLDFCGYFQMRFHRKPKLTRRTSDANPTKPVKPRKPLPKRTEPDLENQSDLNENNPSLQITSLHSCTQPPAISNHTIAIPKELLQTEESRDLTLQLARDFINPDTLDKTSWNDIAGHADVKRALEDSLVLPFAHPALFARCGLAHATSGMLLAGLPGTGKTLLARAAAARAGMAFLSVQASSLGSRWRGDGERLVRAAFELARHNAPAVLFVDEADALLGERGGMGEHEATRRCKSEFLQQLDGIASNDQAVLFLASTNMPWSLDPAILRRFQRIFHVGLPDVKDRLQMMRKSLDKIKLDDGVDLEGIASRMEGFSGSDVVRVCEVAKRILFRRLVEEKERKPAVLLGSDFEEALKSVHPPSSRLWEAKYESWKSGKAVSHNFVS